MNGDLAPFVARLAARARPGEELEVYAVRRCGVEVRVLGEDVDSLSTAQVAGIGVRLISDGRQGFSFAGVLDEAAGAEAVQEARDNAEYGMPDPAVGLPFTGDFPTERRDLALASPLFEAFPTEAKVELARALAQRVRDLDPRVDSVQADYGDGRVHTAIANSRGVADEQERTFASLFAYAVVEDGDEARTGFGYDLARNPADFDVDPIGAEAVERAVRLLGAEQPHSGRVPVVFDQFVTAAFLSVVAGTLNAEAVLKDRSIFADRLGESIAAPAVALVDDPTDVAAYGATAFDAEGVPTSRLVLVDAGILRTFTHNTYTGRRLAVATTGSAARASYKSTPGVGVRALGLVPGEADLDDLIRRADGGVYVQSVQGLHSGVNSVSGDFSVGIEGLRIEGGELGTPVREATLASTLQRMLLDVVAVGADVRMLSAGPAVPALIGEMTLGGQ